MRLQKYMAKSGVASRRKSEEIILEGRVTINDKLIKELGTKVDKNTDIVKVDWKLIELEEEKVYIMLNKPVGYTTTLKDKHSERKVIDLISGIEERIYPVGRLDEDTEGLLLLSNDGDLTYKLTHPSYEVPKIYIAKVEGVPSNDELNTFRNGIMLDGTLTSRARIKILNESKNTSTLEIEIHEGRNRQVRRMCDYIGHEVIDLKRVSLGRLTLNDLKVGTWRHLSKSEVDDLRNQVI